MRLVGRKLIFQAAAKEVYTGLPAFPENKLNCGWVQELNKYMEQLSLPTE